MKLLFISLGCDKNLVDTEHMLSMITKDALPSPMMRMRQMSSLSIPVDFISDAMEESIQTLV